MVAFRRSISSRMAFEIPLVSFVEAFDDPALAEVVFGVGADAAGSTGGAD